ncbi:hypothetical protein [Streptomyces sp. MMG1121]|uniref:hypothetical protein n=1 Tax=Streptomyces sp. MMG1121 TaxID=1415544 RepID=UPI000B0AB3F4|nr:hypothetical protein [Streptomyces sp. MMG1121]
MPPVPWCGPGRDHTRAPPTGGYPAGHRHATRRQSGPANGNLLALLQLWFHQPEADRDHAARKMAEMLLHMLGVSADEARDLARRPLPAAA